MRATLTLQLTDASADAPASGVRFQLYWCEPAGDVLLRAGTTNADGSTVAPLLDASKFSAGTYKLVLHAGDYLARHADHAAQPCFEQVQAVFVIADAERPARVGVALSPARYSVVMDF
ncbi:MAG TPA: hydroxyisourate hydrolase [Tepidisphaeraceae bacterium]|jgi:5-hydroxyisourate hydrolase